MGADLLKNEIIKVPGALKVLHKLFNYCFEFGVIPSMWTKADISPIPKGGMKNVYLPTSYRGLSLLCTLAKTYTGILNNRFT